MIKIKKGLDLPVLGKPDEKVAEFKSTSHVAVTGLDYVGLKPGMIVKENQVVRKGEPLFAAKENSGVVFTAPCAGRVAAINRGPRRVLESVVIEVDPEGESRNFDTITDERLNGASAGEIIPVLIESGLFTAFRQRPFSRIPAPESRPHSIFVTSIDSDPLGFDPGIVISRYVNDFVRGLTALTRITQNEVYNVVHESFNIKLPPIEHCLTLKFGGRHPCGLVGTHIHMLDPVHENKAVWHIGAQDVIAIGRLLATGELWNERYVAMGGPPVREPRILHTTAGADILELTEGEMTDDRPVRLIAGSILNGRRVDGAVRYLDRYSYKIGALDEDHGRKLLGWIRPGLKQHSAGKTFLSSLFPARKLNITSKRNGGVRPVVPLGIFEQLMPLDILPTQLAKALLMRDVEECLRLGVLELDEEDLALMTYACSGKNDYGALLREVLQIVFKEGA
jgi:Na+-transporting NADH:ubiquinone oxidoreductase subunit A